MTSKYLAEFIGTNGSMGLMTGCTYWVTDVIGEKYICILVDGKTIPYESLSLVLANWRIF